MTVREFKRWLEVYDDNAEVKAFDIRDMDEVTLVGLRDKSEVGDPMQSCLEDNVVYIVVED